MAGATSAGLDGEAPYALDRVCSLLKREFPLAPDELAEVDRLLDLVSAEDFAVLMANPQYQTGLMQLERYDMIKAWPAFALFGLMLLLCLTAGLVLI